MAKKLTAFQKLDRALTGNWGVETQPQHVNTYDMSKGSDILYRTTNKDDYDKTKLELQQNKYLKDQWYKSNVNLEVSAFANLNYIQLMYRDAELMDAFPEIGAALDTFAEESCLPSSENGGGVVNVYSKSERIRSILEDLFVNRLNLQITAPMVIRAMCKYGNQFMLLNIDNKLGVKGWRQLPVFDVERIENGIQNPYAGGGISVSNHASTTDSDDPDVSTTFIWNSQGQSQVPFRNWQIGHFRLLTNSMYLPYGISLLNSARRHFRMLSLMEDMMFIYRLERSMERRVYKIYVGAIDDADVPAYIENIANQFKRTPIVDPMTGQIDLRKNILPVRRDTPIPLLDGRTITIEELAKEYEEGKENFVYSVQDGTHQIVPGKVAWCGKNYTAEKLVKITVNDNTYAVMAPEHEVIMSDGSKKRADELQPNDSVIPFSPLNNNTTCYVEKTEIIDGDDVYCMTVMGPNGEEDRHNFALKTWKQDESWNDDGFFVSNCVDNDLFIPVRSENTATPIDTLSAGQNLTAMDDIKFVQNKLATALRIPKAFMNFEEAAGDGKNLALMDIRFTRIINHIQQAFLMELTKIASIHLYLLGFGDDITNFSLTMNNPSTQAEQLEIENLQKKIGACRDAISDPGNGIPIMSQMRALKEIMKWSEKDIKENLEEIRLERAIAAELEKTTQIIKRTNIFDTVDRIYGEPGAEYVEEPQQGQGPDGGMGGGPMGGGGGFGGGLDDLGAPGAPTDGDIQGQEGVEPTQDMQGDSGPQNGPDQQTPMESKMKRPVLTEEKQNQKLNYLFEKYMSKLGQVEEKKTPKPRPNIIDKSVLINEEFTKMMTSLDNLINEEVEEETPEED